MDGLPTTNSYRLGGAPIIAGEYPFHSDPAQGLAKLTACLDSGITLFVDLTTAADGLTPYEAALQELAADRGVRIRRVALGIPDIDIPTPEVMRSILDTLDEAAAAGESVFLHCWGGVGRTGTVVGCYLVRHGMSGPDALRQVNAWFHTMSPEKVRRHSGGAPETERQRRFVLEWSEPAKTETP